MKAHPHHQNVPLSALTELLAVEADGERGHGLEPPPEARLDGELQERLATLTLLSRGMVHDLNGLLTAVLLTTDAMERDRRRDADTQASDLVTIKACAHQAVQLLDQFVSFVKSEQASPEHVDVEVLLEELRLIFKALVGNRAVIDYRYGPGRPRVFANRTEIQRVVVNLVQNAAESFQRLGGQIRISSGVDGEHAFIEVVDGGSGMDPVTQSRMFEPFFTTKGSGTGLGLVIVRRIVGEHHGTIEVESALGKGTRVRVRLPHVPRPEP